MNTLEEPILSVVIPLYKGKTHIQKNVDTANRIAHSKEILIVNDGSPDDSEEYCRELYAQDNNVKVLSKPNGGVVSARNYGLEHATGKYIVFFDQDDFCVPETVDAAIDVLESNHAPMLIWSTEHIYEDNSTAPCGTVAESVLLPKEKIAEELICPTLTFRHSPHISYLGHLWSALFDRRFLDSNGITFKAFVNYEDDFLFILDTLSNADAVFLLAQTGYYWYANRKSLSHNCPYVANYLKKCDVYIDYLREIAERCAEGKSDAVVTGWMKKKLLDALYNIARNPDDLQEKNEFIRRAKDRNYQKALREGASEPLTRFGKLMLFCLKRRMIKTAIALTARHIK